MQKLPYTFSKKHGVLVETTSHDTVCLVHKNELPRTVLLELRRTCERPITLKKIPDDQFDQLLRQTYETDANTTKALAANIEEEFDLNHLVQNLPVEDLLESHAEAPIIRLLNGILTQAIKQKASDIHIEPYEEALLIRFRIDGVLQEIIRLQANLSPFVISRFKVMARLDIAEKRLPQDGRITLRIADHNIDVRVSTLPSNHGERMVLRLLDKKVACLDLTVLGMAPSTHESIEALIKRPNGILLVTGPTGSGKTTSLYAMLTKLNQTSRNILTVEDPIEYDLPGIGQTQVNTKIEMNFAKGLRAILRQDPDIVMVGEIRDLETVEIAVQASLTGHLVLSTLHTNSAVGAITRLRDMGVEPFLLSSTIIGVLAQRLVRLLCPDCKIAKAAEESEQLLLNTNITELFHPVGCNDCNHTGFKGRTGIYELIIIDETLQKMIHDNLSEQQLENYVRTKTTSMRQDGFRCVSAGLTTIEEVLRVAHEE